MLSDSDSLGKSCVCMCVCAHVLAMCPHVRRKRDLKRKRGIERRMSSCIGLETEKDASDSPPGVTWG